MLNEPNWIKGQRIESGNFPTSSFIDVLTAMYPTYNENLKATVLQLDFESGKTYNIPCFSKDKQWGIHEDGTYDSFNAIGQFLSSIEALGVVSGQQTAHPDDKHIEVFFAWLNGELTGIKTEPDIVGKTLHNVAKPRQVGDATQTSKYPDWTIGQIEGLTAAPVKVKSGKYPSKPKEYPSKPKAQKEQPPTQTDNTPAIIDLLPATIGEIYEALKAKGVRCLPAEIRTVLTESGAVKDGDIYKL